MAISTGAALLGSAVIGAGTSMLAGSKQSKAARQAAELSAESNAQNVALQREIYNSNVGYIAPWMQQGQVANNAIMQLLGLAPSGPITAPTIAQPQVSAFGGPSYNTPVGREDYAYSGGLDRGYAFGAMNPLQYGATFAATPTTAAPSAFGAPSAASGFDAYRNSTGYNFRVNEGMRGLQAAFGRNLESGAAAKSAIRYGQGIASDEFANYVNLLDNQQKLGFGGASALAGVGTNFANTVSAGNTAAANAAANARLYAGNAQANALAGIGSSFAGALGYYANPFGGR